MNLLKCMFKNHMEHDRNMKMRFAILRAYVKDLAKTVTNDGKYNKTTIHIHW